MVVPGATPQQSAPERLIPEWERSPTDPLHLLLLLKGIRCTLAERAAWP